MEIHYLFEIVLSLLTLTVLEIVLGIDNLVFVAILSQRASPKKRKLARLIGLSMALIARLLVLAGAMWIIKLNHPWFSVMGQSVSIRDLFLLGGGVFLLVKGTLEIHAEFESAAAPAQQTKFTPFALVIIQIALFDIIFSFDSILTAVGLTDKYWIMASAIFVAILSMLIASEYLSRLSLKLNGTETIDILGLEKTMTPRMDVTMRITYADGRTTEIPLACRIDTQNELEYYKNGGILHYVLRKIATA